MSNGGKANSVSWEEKPRGKAGGLYVNRWYCAQAFGTVECLVLGELVAPIFVKTPACVFWSDGVSHKRTTFELGYYFTDFNAWRFNFKDLTEMFTAVLTIRLDLRWAPTVHSNPTFVVHCPNFLHSNICTFLINLGCALVHALESSVWTKLNWNSELALAKIHHNGSPIIGSLNYARATKNKIWTNLGLNGVVTAFVTPTEFVTLARIGCCLERISRRGCHEWQVQPVELARASAPI